MKKMLTWRVQIWYEDEWIKMYNWKADLRYYIYLPRFIVCGLLGIYRKEHILNEMSKQDYLSLLCAMCDARAGRFYRWVRDEWVTVASGIRFDYSDRSACKKFILENYPKIAKQVEGESWDVEVEY